MADGRWQIADGKEAVCPIPLAPLPNGKGELGLGVGVNKELLHD